MTSDRTGLLCVFAALAALLFAGCTGAGASRREGLTQAQIAALPPHVSDAYPVFARKCSRCHTLSRPLNAEITDFARWEAYVSRMRRQPGSGISDKDGDVILVFLKYLAEEKSKKGTETSTASE